MEQSGHQSVPETLLLSEAQRERLERLCETCHATLAALTAVERGEILPQSAELDDLLGQMGALFQECEDAKPAVREEELRFAHWLLMGLPELLTLGLLAGEPEPAERMKPITEAMGRSYSRLAALVQQDRQRRRGGEAIEAGRHRAGPRPLAGVELAVQERIAEFEQKGERWTVKDVWRSLGERGWEGERDGWALSVERRGHGLVQCSTRGSEQREQAIVFHTFRGYVTAARKKI